MRRFSLIMITSLTLAASAPAASAGNRAGSLDHSFSGNGRARIDLLEGRCNPKRYYCYDQAEDVAIDSKGRIVVAGDTGIVRLHPNGQLDRSFADQGKLLFPFRGTSGGSTSMVVDSEDRVVYSDENGTTRLTPDGSPDPSFSGDGHLSDAGGLLAIDSQDRIIAAAVIDPPGPERSGAVVRRITADGEPDPTFESHPIQFGTSSFDGEPNPSHPTEIVLDDQDRIVMAGIGNDTSENDSPTGGLARLLPDGALDSSFSEDGLGAYNHTGYSSIAIDDAGGIVAGAVTSITRVLPDGSTDEGFGDDGVVVTGSAELRHFRGYTVDTLAVDDEDRIFVGGRLSQRHYRKTSKPDGDLARYKPSGELDRSFGKRGRADARFENPMDLTFDRKQRIVTVGSKSSGPSSRDYAIARYLGG